MVKDGASKADAARYTGLSASLLSLHQVRTEAEIRADLARQLEGIEKRFGETVRAARLEDPIT